MDIILTWVDGSDPSWQKDFKKSSQLYYGEQKDVRFRDWDNLHYWFRGIEQFAPWVRKIHLVTCGHYPSWLNINHPKLNLVKHTDYIPEKYLPTFNSNVIELFFHRIEGLSEEFILFNDDFFFINKVESSRFFQKGIPCDIFALNAISDNDFVGHTILNNIGTLNKHRNKRDFIKKHIGKYFNYRYGIHNFRSLCLLPWPNFTGFVDHHFPQPYLKSTFEEIWKRNIFSDIVFSNFRNNYNYSHYLMRYWQLTNGNFKPLNLYKDSIYYTVENNNLDTVQNEILNQNKSIIILNDSDNINFEKARSIINKSFETILPHKSQFEI